MPGHVFLAVEIVTPSFCVLFQKAENDLRVQKGDAPLPDEDLNKLFKPLQAPPRLDSLLLAGQIAAYSDQVSEFASQSFGKLFMAESLNATRDTGML